MSCDENFVTCYNRGCGQKYNPATNSEDSCRFHAGVPFFHDAYKGWSCCNKKCTDFTEFLNIPGCTVSRHSNVKPVEPPKPSPVETEIPDTIEVKPVEPVIVRPSFDTPMTVIKPTVAPSVKQQISSAQSNTVSIPEIDSSVVQIDTPCQNNGCKVSYRGIESDSTVCIHHPGYPIFHEGLKYWSCCQKRTSDFQTFLNQEGCTTGCHVWHKKENKEAVECRWDWHQTGNDVVISIYAKEYCSRRSIIKINPIRVYVDLVFPKQNDATFNLDIETTGIINVESSHAAMFGTKVEIKLRKANLTKWEKLDFPRPKQQVQQEKPSKVENITPQVDAIDLDDL